MAICIRDRQTRIPKPSGAKTFSITLLLPGRRYSGQGPNQSVPEEALAERVPHAAQCVAVSKFIWSRICLAIQSRRL